MNIKTERTELSDAVQYKFDGDISVSTVKELKELIVNELNMSSEVELDLSKVEKFDTAAFQLILFLKREAERNKKHIVVKMKSKSVSRVFDLYGISV